MFAVLFLGIPFPHIVAAWDLMCMGTINKITINSKFWHTYNNNCDLTVTIIFHTHFIIV